ncbi:hypothetical protein GH714_026491 [Hevea brasiliensis]|uniref:Glutaredoxin domain-containing protein n=1 Tax=Hevea brasiliensis TaxID=3981 RepID=A0A6A6KUH0_HEVBR|nr:hypothetical protein GH714_026491 [Hevea brasiliensis]
MSQQDADRSRFESWLLPLGPGSKRLSRRPWLRTQSLFTPKLGARRYSSEVKTLFKKLGAEPLVIELDEMGPQGPQLQKVLERLTGQHTVPNVFIGGQHIGGCTDTLKLYRKGELEPLLSEAKSKSSQG